ncbi:phytoene desaturase family protein [Aeromicrobium sp.]|uniref:phytoene desaturase family protein n=1 Tax=Aeromicrobium sp. TaxID=1871063 RepID=UPI003D6B40B9
MARVVVVGGGFAGMSAAARLAKLRHDVILLEAGDQLGGRLRGHTVDGVTWQLSPDTVTLPGVLRDLFRKSGRPIERVVDLVLTPGRRHVFDDRSVLDLPLGNRGDQHDAVVEAFGEDSWSPWVDSLADEWDTLRRSVLDRLLDERGDLDRSTRRALAVRRSLARLARRDLPHDQLRSLVLDNVRLDGHDPSTTPAFVAVQHYVERSFGRWRVEGGLPALADALVTRLEERKVDVRTGALAHELEVTAGRVRGVITQDDHLDADVVVWCAPTLPAPIPEPRGLPAIPASRTLITLADDAPELPLDLIAHSNPPVHVWSDGSPQWTLAHHNAEDPVIALARVGIRIKDHVVEQHDLGPAELVRLGHWGWTWQAWTTLFDRPGVGAGQRLGGTLFMAGAHAHPGGTIEEIGSATAVIADAIGPAPR